jgi:hypothetical protein
MSRRRFAVCLGLLVTGCSATAVAQQSDGFSYTAGQYSGPQAPVYHQPEWNSTYNANRMRNAINRPRLRPATIEMLAGQCRSVHKM